jgi:hypothetical protein
LLSSFSHPFEYIEEGHSSYAFSLPLENDAEQVIRRTLSFIFPTVKTKLLPDKTIAKHLIADSESWQFETLADKRSLVVPENDTTIEIIRSSSNQLIRVFTEIEENEDLPVEQILCRPEGTSPWLYYRWPSGFGITSLTLKRTSLQKTEICLN